MDWKPPDWTVLEADPDSILELGSKIAGSKSPFELASVTVADSNIEAGSVDFPGIDSNTKFGPYVYNGLLEDLHQVRLLSLDPSSGSSDEVSCQLITVSLTECPEFEALSYVWGDAKDIKPIQLAGHDHQVTANLHTILGHIRHKDGPRLIWADAVCIKQDDRQERASQIRLMRSIYSQASQVLIWLGEGRASDRSICELSKVLQVLEDDPELHWDPQPEGLGRSLADSGVRGGFSIVALVGLFSSRWWTRIWTVQEFLLAKSHLFLWGSDRASPSGGYHSFSSSALFNAHRSYRRHNGSCCNRVGGMDFDLANELKVIAELDTCYNSPEPVNMLPLLSIFRDRDATKDRDRLYGLLGLDADLPHTMISYDCTAEEAFARWSRDYVDKTKNLDLLSLATRPGSMYDNEDFSDDRDSNLPSWVPDRRICLTQKEHELMKGRLAILDNYSASRGNVHIPPFTSTAALGIRVAIIDRIDRVSGTSSSPGILHCGIPDWHDFYHELLRTEAHKTQQHAHSTAEWLAYCERFYYVFGTSRPAQFYEMASTWSQDEKTSARSELESSFLINTYARRFFVSRKGYVGLAPMGAKRGDCIAVAMGGRIPYILRKTNRKLRTGGSAYRCYTVLGDCYVHGLVDGEAMDMLEAGSVGLQDVCLI